MRLLYQVPGAFVIGLFYYMVAMLMTTYDGVLSMVFQPVMGSILTLVGIVICLVVGLPIRAIRRVEEVWWMSFVLGSIGFLLMFLSGMKEFRVLVFDPNLNAMVSSFNPALGLSGWFLTIFSVLHFTPPLPSIRSGTVVKVSSAAETLKKRLNR